MDQYQPRTGAYYGGKKRSPAVGYHLGPLWDLGIRLTIEEKEEIRKRENFKFL